MTPRPARFRAGDRVRARSGSRDGHTRLPRYLRGCVGTVEKVHGVFALPDERALGVDLSACTKETLYTVVFEGTDVWRHRLSEPLAVSADLWDSYLEPEPTP
jgi:nitrile hydratase